MIPEISLRTALSEASLLGGVLTSPQPGRLRRLLGAQPQDTWASWKPLLLSMMGEPLTDAEMAVWRKFTNRETAPTEMAREVCVIAGRRSGKDRIAALLSTYLAALCDWSDCLVRGETGIVLCVGADKEQAAVTFRYIEGCFDGSPMLSRRVVSRTSDSLVLDTGIEIQVRAANYRRIRGLTTCAVVCSEVAFWQSADGGSANPDEEILRALRPSLATTQGPMLLISSPYARTGSLFELYDRHWGKDGSPVLIFNAKTRDLNPTIPLAEITRAFEEDAEAAEAEWNGKFRSDIAQFIGREAVMRCVDHGVLERGPDRYEQAVAFVDSSGGSSDSMTLAIAHMDKETENVIVDLIREVVPPFSPDQVVKEFASELRRFNIREVTGDRYGGEWVPENFRRHDIKYVPSTLSASELYGELLPLINRRGIRLLDHPKSLTQLLGLERRTGRIGRDSISHKRGGHDDISNVIAGAAYIAGTGRKARTLVGAVNHDGTLSFRDPREIDRGPLSGSRGRHRAVGWLPPMPWMKSY